MEAGLGFSHRQNGDRFNVFAAPLGLRIEETHGVQFIAEEFCTDGLVGGRGVDVNDAASDCKLAGAFHHAAAAVTGS